MSSRRALGHPRWREGFRETFLVVFTRKGDASALRRLTLLLSELYVNAAPRWWPYPKGSELDAILHLQVPLGQGYVFGRPGPGWPRPRRAPRSSWTSRWTSRT